MGSPNVPETQKAEWQKAKENIAETLQQLEAKNYFAYSVFPLSDAIDDHPDIKKIVDAYKSRFPEKREKPSHDSRGGYKPRP